MQMAETLRLSNVQSRYREVYVEAGKIPTLEASYLLDAFLGYLLDQRNQSHWLLGQYLLCRGRLIVRFWRYFATNTDKIFLPLKPDSVPLRTLWVSPRSGSIQRFNCHVRNDREALYPLSVVGR